MLIEELKKRGYRAPPQRAIILQAIEALSGHTTAEEIFEQVQQTSPYISLATVYRTLELLKALGLIAESDMGTPTATYALKTHGSHHHAVCRKCGATIELPHQLFEPFVAELQATYNFTADANHLTIFGWCAACTAEETID
jgi:Fur family ferric uptake transcriptional regulator